VLRAVHDNIRDGLGMIDIVHGKAAVTARSLDFDAAHAQETLGEALLNPDILYLNELNGFDGLAQETPFITELILGDGHFHRLVLNVPF
jgi:hypothetical protein